MLSMELLKYINNNKEDFVKVTKQIINKTIHPRISEELQKLRDYLNQLELQEFLNQEKYCIYENYGVNEEDNFIEINYLTTHNEGYLTDHYETDFEYDFFSSIPAIAESMESVYSRIMLYNQDREHIIHHPDGSFDLDNDYYDPTNNEEIYLLQETVKILCEYQAFQLLEYPYNNN